MGFAIYRAGFCIVCDCPLTYLQDCYDSVSQNA